MNINLLYNQKHLPSADSCVTIIQEHNRRRLSDSIVKEVQVYVSLLQRNPVASVGYMLISDPSLCILPLQK